MFVVLEGIDNSGKSTLAIELQKVFRVGIQRSEGPPKYPGEMDERLERYSQYSSCIFDRHPCVSQVIYGMMRGEIDFNQDLYVPRFYDAEPFLIYCDPLGRRMHGHQERIEVDTPKHVSFIDDNYDSLLFEYRAWAIAHAHWVYRIGDPIEHLLGLARNWR